MGVGKRDEYYFVVVDSHIQRIVLATEETTGVGKRDEYYSVVVDSHIQRIVLVCVFSSHPFWTSSSLDVPDGVTQEEGHTGFCPCN